jgi:hypothetical protein
MSTALLHLNVSSLTFSNFGVPDREGNGLLRLSAVATPLLSC